LPEIAVFGGTAHPALSAGICADRGVRCAAEPGQQRHCLAVLPGRGVGQRIPEERAIRFGIQVTIRHPMLRGLAVLFDEYYKLS
jgi:delta 1-pyrroline-5-carboxylate dehydrogenase